MHRYWHRIYSEQTDSFGIAHTDRPGICEFDFRKRHAFTENTPFLIRSPLRRQRQQLLQLVDGCLSIPHRSGKKQKPSRTEKNLSLDCERFNDSPNALARTALKQLRTVGRPKAGSGYVRQDREIGRLNLRN